MTEKAMTWTTMHPTRAPDLIIDWMRFARMIQAHRIRAGIGTQGLATASGVARAQILQAEQALPVSAGNFLRLCAVLERDPAFFATTLGGWRPHRVD